MDQALFPQPMRFMKSCLVEVTAGYIWDCIWRSRVRITLMFMVCAALGWFGWPEHAYPEGSRFLYPSTYPGGGWRANLDFQPGQLYMGKVRRSWLSLCLCPGGESTSYLAPATDPMEVTSLFTIRRISGPPEMKFTMRRLREPLNLGVPPAQHSRARTIRAGNWDGLNTRPRVGRSKQRRRHGDRSERFRTLRVSGAREWR